MPATRADRVAAQHAEYLGTTPLDTDTTGLAADLDRDWRNAQRSHRLPAGLVVGLLTAAKTQSTTQTGSAA